ncbi:hypothetical protein H0H87_008974 [Tephrocybe sp. NHM501043]|nr:hypothetical protein H0H87_008974 [Tephrocybe sp. NHM501043]
MYWGSLAIVVQVSDLELDHLKAEHQAAQATWMKENRDFKKWLTAADNKVNNSNEVILSLMTNLTTQLDSFKKEQGSIVHYVEKEHTTHIEELQKKIAVLKEDVQDGHKRLDLELDEKSKTAVQVQTSISLLNNRLSEEQVQKVEYKTSSESAMTCIEELQKKIAVLEEDVQDRHKRLEIELNEKSKTAIQVQTSISLLNDRLSEEQAQKMEYKTSSESAMESMKSAIAETDRVKEELREHIEQVTKLNATINKLQNNLKIQDVHISSNTARYQVNLVLL